MSSTTQRLSRLQHGYCIGVSRRSAQATAGKGLAQGPYMAARAGVEPTTFRLKAIDSTKAPQCPTTMHSSLCMPVPVLVIHFVTLPRFPFFVCVIQLLAKSNPKLILLLVRRNLLFR